MDQGPNVVEELASEIEIIRRTPENDTAWDHLEKTASEVDQLHAVAALYDDVLRGQLGIGVAQRIGERAVRFHEEWSPDDPAGLVRILDRLLEIEPTSAWAFERLVVTLTVAGRWDDLFAQFDRAIAGASKGQKTKLLEEAAQVARDVAAQPER